MSNGKTEGWLIRMMEELKDCGRVEKIEGANKRLREKWKD